MLTKRTMQLGGYDTAAHHWTLVEWSLPEPDPVTNMQDVPGRIKGPLNLSNVLTDGLPTYGSRPFSATLETSEGDRLAREARISDIVNHLHGQQKEIVLPDHPNHYAVGVFTVSRDYNDLAHGAVKISGTCEPWLYARAETVVTLQAAEVAQTAELINLGVMPVVPVLQVTGGSVIIATSTASFGMEPGTYKWPELYLTPGEHVVTYQGTGTLTITYREAVLR